jgi:hypothetical protein
MRRPLGQWELYLPKIIVPAALISMVVACIPASHVPHHKKVHKKVIELAVMTPTTTTTTVPVALSKWDTTATDPTASWPDASDPMWAEPISVQEKFACVRYHESRNHRVDTTVSSGAEGWYMFMPYEWKVARAHVPGLPAHPNEATGDQQSAAALWYYDRNNSLAPEWSLDAC